MLGSGAMKSLVLVLLLATTVRAQGLFDLFAPKPSKVEEELVSGEATEQQKILLVHVNGLISSSVETPLAKAATPDRLRWQLERAEKDPWVRAIVVEINSPGGEVTASDVMYRMLRAISAKKKVVALLGDVAASGGYYIAAAAEKIVAHPTTITGSIGVIMHSANFSGLMEKIGVKPVIVKSTTTPMKDILSPTREMTAEEKKLLEDILDEMYERFAGVVGTSRKLKPDEVKRVADGRIYTAGQALKAKLVDEVGYREDALKLAMKLASMKSGKLVRYKKPVNFLEALGGAENLFQGALGAVQDPRLLMELGRPRFMYMLPY